MTSVQKQASYLEAIGATAAAALARTEGRDAGLYNSVISAARTELGTERLAAELAKSAPPELLFFALRNIPSLPFELRQSLLKSLCRAGDAMWAFYALTIECEASDPSVDCLKQTIVTAGDPEWAAKSLAHPNAWFDKVESARLKRCVLDAREKTWALYILQNVRPLEPYEYTLFGTILTD